MFSTLIDVLWIAISAILAALLLGAVVVLGCCAVKLVSADEQAAPKPDPEPELEFDSLSRAEIDFTAARLLREDRRRRRRRTRRRPGSYLIR